MDLLGVPRRQITSAVQAAFDAARFPQEQYSDPPGDPGLFGPDSVTWRVHGDPSMVVGGLAALMLQALHPLALAGVFDHSNFRDDPLRRLSRTASFVRATTYGSTEVADAVIDTVRRMHERVVGTAPNGLPYRAGDPDLLRWVHVAEVSCFLSAHRRYHPHPVGDGDLDRYYAETAVVAEKLGATGIPTGRDEVRAYYRDVRPQLAVTERTRETFGFILAPVGRDPASASVSFILGRAAVGALPRWARRLYGISYPEPVERAAIMPAAALLLAALRWAGDPAPVVGAATARAARI
jgi:uncharacterized protein (DUF2236 family)